jgi:hypothetical protein
MDPRKYEDSLNRAFVSDIIEFSRDVTKLKSTDMLYLDKSILTHKFDSKECNSVNKNIRGKPN